MRSPGLYYSQSQDWHEPGGAGNTWDFGPDDYLDIDRPIPDPMASVVVVEHEGSKIEPIK